MAPWCNRVPAGPAVAAGRRLDLPAELPRRHRDPRPGLAAAWQARRSRRSSGSGPAGMAGRGRTRSSRAPDRRRLAPARAPTDEPRDDLDAGRDRLPPMVPCSRSRWRSRRRRVHRSNLATEREPVPVDGPLDRHRLEPMPDDLDATWSTSASRRSGCAGPTRASGHDHVRRADRGSSTRRARPDRRRRGRAADPRARRPPPARTASRAALRLLDPGETLALAVRVAFGPRGR